MDTAPAGTAPAAVPGLQPLSLRQLQPIGVGRVRLVYVHPQLAGLVVKVIRPDHLEQKWGAGGRWYKRRVRLRQYTIFLRELREYLALRARHPRHDLPMARLMGLVDTDLGLGLVSERIEWAPSQPALTLGRLVATRGGFDGELRAALDQLVCSLLELDIVVTDLGADNPVARQDRFGRLELVLVDGFGDKNIIPRLALFPVLNRRNTRLRPRRLVREFAARGAAGRDSRVDNDRTDALARRLTPPCRQLDAGPGAGRPGSQSPEQAGEFAGGIASPGSGCRL